MGARAFYFFFFFDYCYFNRDTQGEPLRRREAVMLLAINWIEILVINEAKNVNKHSPLYNCLLFIWASFFVGLGPKFSIVKSASVDSKLPHQWSRYEISQTNFLTTREIQNTFTLSTFSKSHEFQESSVSHVVIVRVYLTTLAMWGCYIPLFIQNNNLRPNYRDEKIP